MLLVEDLRVEIDGKEILQHIDMEIQPGEVHVLFGPNGSGKTSLLMTLMGYPQYKVTYGRIEYKGVDITNMPVNERAQMGMGVMYQRPPTIHGLKTRHMVNICSGNGGNEEELAQLVNMQDFLDRDLNAGFSGGELKRSEILQLMAQAPDLVLLDEPESGVDLENILLVGEAINRLLEREIHRENSITICQSKEQRSRSGLIITHTGFILDYVTADIGQVLYKGHMSCKSNPREVLRCIDKFGYGECVRCVI